MATAAYNARVYITGTSTGLTGAPGEPMTDLAIGGAKVTWQITAEAKRIVDPATAIVIYDDTTGIAYAHPYSIDFLFGTVTLSVAAVSSIKIQGNYLPRAEITNAYEYDLSLSKTLADTSVFQNGFVTRTATLGDVSGSLSCYDNTSTSYSGVTLKSVFDSTTPKVLEVDMSATKLRAFVLMESSDLSAGVDGVQTLSSSFSCASVDAVTGGQEVDFAFGT